MNDQIPLIRQMHDAGDNRSRADILLRCPDAVLLKHAHVFREACARVGWTPGVDFVDGRVALMLAVRDAAGMLPMASAQGLDMFRADMAAFAAGNPPEAARAPPSLDL